MKIWHELDRRLKISLGTTLRAISPRRLNLARLRQRSKLPVKYDLKNACGKRARRPHSTLAKNCEKISCDPPAEDRPEGIHPFAECGGRMYLLMGLCRNRGGSR